ncbi:MAG: DUF3029 family protein [Ruminococcaceae bacterium]|nr:DUF3029 family protein [Oscillospiraceae bacterium]
MPLNREALEKYAFERIDFEDEYDVLKTDCDIIEFLLDNCEITLEKENYFFVNVNCKNVLNKVYMTRFKKYSLDRFDKSLMPGREVFAYTGYADLGHTNVKWEDVISLGIYGLKNRIISYSEKYSTDDKKQRFYSNTLRVYEAALRFIKRASKKAYECGKNEMAINLEFLSENSPSTLYQAMQTSIIYYTLQQLFEGTHLRTLGRLDTIFYPFYDKTKKEETYKLLKEFFWEIDRFCATANIPFALGGTNTNGMSKINELSYMILDTYMNENTSNIKMHLLCSKNTEDDIIKQALGSVRLGKNSIVFMSDEKVIESLVKIKAERDDATNYHVVGCYECGADGEITCSCNARVNLPKALEYALTGGIDIVSGEKIGLDKKYELTSFENLCLEFTHQLEYLCNCAIRSTDYYEESYKNVHAAPIMSATYTSALEKGGDLYCDYSAKYNNSSLNALGLATAVDSLCAIQKLVFEDETYSLDEFVNILKSNWDNNEPLRLLIKNKFPKFGTANKKVDKIAQNIVNVLSNLINGRPNKKGGIYRLGLFSIDWRWEFGEKLGASADGRKKGEPISQNTSATFGADKEGATSHLISVASLDTSNTPNGTIIDIDLHSSAVQGENGLNALISSLKTYFELGGFAVHYNVLDTNVLKDAKLNPEKYPNLQVRLCGWNVLFSTLSDKEKDEFIARSVR